MVVCLEEINPEVIGNNYLAMGIVDRKDWKDGNIGKLNSAETLERAYFFKDMLKFKLVPGGWYPAVKKQTATAR